MLDNIKILIVEDDEDINRLLCDMLDRNRYITKAAYSGTEALIYLENNEWDMIILDLMLQGINGEDLLVKIRKHKQMPVIIISAKEGQDVIINTLKMGADDFITKPFDIGEVCARIDANLRRYKQFSGASIENSTFQYNIKRGIAMKEEVLLVDNVHKTINGREIIKGISFSIKAGEVLGFLGPNGSGKSTTLRMIVGLSKPTEGEIKICGQSIVKNYVKAMRNVGCIIEGPDLYNYMTGWDNLEMLAVMNKNITKEDIMNAASIVGMEKHLKEKVGTYSLGMKQRMGVAQAIMNKPKLLILDEPTNGLDPSGINEFRNLINRFAKEDNMAVLISSHLMSEIELICDNVSIIKNGVILKNAGVKDLLSTEEVFWILDDNKKGMDILSDVWAVNSKIDGEKLVASIDKSLISEINASFIREGLKLQYVDNKHKTLEDLFLNITED